MSVRSSSGLRILVLHDEKLSSVASGDADDAVTNDGASYLAVLTQDDRRIAAKSAHVFGYARAGHAAAQKARAPLVRQYAEDAVVMWRRARGPELDSIGGDLGAALTVANGVLTVVRGEVGCCCAAGNER